MTLLLMCLFSLDEGAEGCTFCQYSFIRIVLFCVGSDVGICVADKSLL